MKLSTEDPRLTAYALGEIDAPDERRAIEAAVQASPELKSAVDDIRAMAGLLHAQLVAESAPKLNEFEKARLGEAPAPAPGTSGIRGRRELKQYWPLFFGLAAACAVVAIIWLWLPTGQDAVQYAIGEHNETPADHDEAKIVVNTSATEDLDARVQQLGERVRNGEQSPAEREAAHKLRPKPAPSLTMPQAMPQSMPTDAPHRTRTVSNIAVASVEVQLPQMEESITVSGELGTIDGKHLLGFHRGSIGLGMSEVNTFGLKTRFEEDAFTFHETFNTESYDLIEETGFRSPSVAPLSTFSIDVDTASYANVRRFLTQGKLPPANAVRIEEMINYFAYSDAPPAKSLEAGGDPFAVHLAQTYAPWQPEHRLLRIALKGYEMPWAERPASNLVFLLDVSGSMKRHNRLPLVKEAMDLLLRRLDTRDRVAIVVYAGASGLHLPSTTANNQETIWDAIERLEARGLTNAGSGIQLAYETALEHFIEGGNNRVILCTDGDFNVGQTDRGELGKVVEAAADKGVALTVLGFGMGNLRDNMLETLSTKGKGSYAYIDSSAEAGKVFIEDLTSNLFTIAHDVKIQVEFNPAHVGAYRLIGYENRRLQAEDFNNDRKRAGDIGPGHTVTALYEIIPAGSPAALRTVDALRYQPVAEAVDLDDADRRGELATVKLRYKRPRQTVSELIEATVSIEAITPFADASEDLRFGAAVAAFGMRLRGSPYVGEFGLDAIEQIAVDAIGRDPGGHRSRFTDLVRRAERLMDR